MNQMSSSVEQPHYHRYLQDLLQGKSIPASRINSAFADELTAEHLLYVQVHGTRKTYKAIDTDSLRNYLITLNEHYRILEADDTTSRSQLAANTGNSKLSVIRSCPGFMVNSYEPIRCQLKGKEFIVNPPEGSMVFVSDWRTFVVPRKTVIVGIENMENFRMIHRQRDLFLSCIGQRQLLFASRYPQSSDLRNWLKTIDNEYVHFGDFDLAGISIYINEFQQYLNQRSSYLIPSDIDNRLQVGSSERYDRQYKKFHNLKSSDSKLQSLIDLIHSKRKGYDQEGYIEK